MHKAIGLITCASVMAVSLYLFSGGDPSRTLSAQTDSASGTSYDAAARRFMQEARELAAQGKTDRARKLAETAAGLDIRWNDGEQTPEQFLTSLDAAPADDNPFAVGEGFDWAPMETPGPAAEAQPSQDDLFGSAAAEPAGSAAGVTSSELLKKRQAQRLMKEAHQAMEAGDYSLARTRALQARQLKAPLSMWDEHPEHLIAELDKLQQTKTFMGAQPAASAAAQDSPQEEDVSANFRQATALVQQARVAMDAGRLSEAQQLARQAEQLGVAFSAWEDSPTLVLRDVERLIAANTAQNEIFSTVAAGSGNHARATQLLREARDAMQQGRLGLAREKALEAQNLDVTYDFLEDTPAVVLREVDAVLRGGSQQAAQPAQDALAAIDTLAQPEARRLVGQARQALRQNDPETARQLAIQAQQQDSAYALFEDRPSLVLEEAHLMAERQRARNGNEALAQHTPVDVTPDNGRGQSAGRADFNVATVNFNDTNSGERLGANADFAVIRPDAASADASFRQGLEYYRQGDRPAAKLAFQQAWQNAGDLDPRKRRQLQDFLQDLANTQTNVVLAASQESGPGSLQIGSIPAEEGDEPDPLAQAASRSDVRYDRLQTEVMNSVFRAERLKDENPDEALQILDNTLATIEAAPLAKESIETLAGYVRRSQSSIQSYKEAQAPNLEREARNRSIREQIETETKARIRIQQDFADLVIQYNQKMDEQSFAEAALLAEKAQDLMPHSPEAVAMVTKAKLAKQVAFNTDIREKQADNALELLNGAERMLADPIGDFTMPGRHEWSDLTTRRSRYSDNSGRELSDAEIQIKRSLAQKVSLHFQETPLEDVIQHIAVTHGINIILDYRSIESDGLFTTQPVTIDVDGISLDSALNILLKQAGGLVHTIENETLTITNKLQQDNTLEQVVYNVADLVVPLSMPSQEPVDPLSGMTTLNNGLYQVEDQLGVTIGGGPRSGKSVVKEARNERDFGALIDLITTVVDPQTWEVSGGNGTLAADENTLSLVIRQTGPVHDQITDLLSQLRKLQDLQVTVEVRFISVSDNFFERIGVDFDFNVNDNLGDPAGVPAFGSRQLTFPGQQQGGGQGGQQQAGDLRGNQNQGGGQGGQNNQNTPLGLFDNVNRVNSPRDDFNGTIAGLASPDRFTSDYDIQFRQGSFEIGIPDFGGYNPNAGIQVGMAILSDIEAFFFIQAAQGDERANTMFAPKVTLFNGQQASVSDQTVRYLVVGQIPVVGTASVGYQPVIAPVPDGISLTVIA
ncbi:MAG: hypothetical protein KDA96_10280, partial [Planctomycetaceae bacterium]|nr:hypothetical protein [Planctomycetaceae bacterium]